MNLSIIICDQQLRLNLFTPTAMLLKEFTTTALTLSPCNALNYHNYTLFLFQLQRVIAKDDNLASTQMAALGHRRLHWFGKVWLSKVMCIVNLTLAD